MRNRTEIFLMVSLSLMVALVAAVMVLPGHPRLEEPEATVEVEVTPAVFAGGASADPGPANSDCPYLSSRAASSACPMLERTHSAAACPYLAAKQKGAECPGVRDQQRSTVNACPYAGPQQLPTAPHGKTDKPHGPNA